MFDGRSGGWEKSKMLSVGGGYTEKTFFLTEMKKQFMCTITWM